MKTVKGEPRDASMSFVPTLSASRALLEQHREARRKNASRLSYEARPQAGRVKPGSIGRRWRRTTGSRRVSTCASIEGNLAR